MYYLDVPVQLIEQPVQPVQPPPHPKRQLPVHPPWQPVQIPVQESHCVVAFVLITGIDERKAIPKIGRAPLAAFLKNSRLV